MSVIERTDTRPHNIDGDSDDGRQIMHTYPGSDARGGAVVGDVALCGWIKRSPLQRNDIPPHLRIQCVVCADLRRGRQS